MKQGARAAGTYNVKATCNVPPQWARLESKRSFKAATFLSMVSTVHRGLHGMRMPLQSFNLVTMCSVQGTTIERKAGHSHIQYRNGL